MKWGRTALGLIGGGLVATLVISALVTAPAWFGPPPKPTDLIQIKPVGWLIMGFYVSGLWVAGCLPFCLVSHALLWRAGRRTWAAYVLTGVALSILAAIAYIGGFNIKDFGWTILAFPVAGAAGALTFWAIRRPDRDAVA